MPSRRKFLSTMPVLGAAVAQSLRSTRLAGETHEAHANEARSIVLEHGWQFCLGSDAVKSPAELAGGGTPWREVSVPHTWQALGGSPDYVGSAWYRAAIAAQADWQASFVRVQFEAVFHTAHVYLNGKLIGQHLGKGYTAFECDLTPTLQFGDSNELLVQVDNTFCDTMLPRLKSFDWANDGGIIRPVHLLVTPRVFSERIEVDTELDLEKGAAKVVIRAVLRNTLPSQQTVRVAGFIDRTAAAEESHPTGEMTVNIPPNSSRTVSLNPTTITSPALWHFDSPNLYCAHISLMAAGELHSISDTFGIRRFEVRGAAFYLNGERVSLMGVERMAGSHPEFGMAESVNWIDANHRDMKHLNCVFTRVHWPQDRRVLDFCDAQGILMQEEVPAWGAFTFDNVSAELESRLTTNGVEQLRDMVHRDRNHPCIVSWGLCNEVNGKNPITRRFAHALADEARQLDPSRLLTYASNSLHENPAEDMAGDFDFVSINEYFGTWSKGGVSDARSYLEGIRKAFPGKPLVISEYGYCECLPEFAPGDQHRVDIIEGHTDLYRESPEIAGAIYFDYNDYRTQLGDKGAGALLQRVHGVVDLYARRKPSFEALRRQSSPIRDLTLIIAGKGFTLHIETRNELPGYTLRGYSVRWMFYGYDDLPMEGQLQPLNPLAPGQSVTSHANPVITGLRRVVAEIVRPTGYSVASAEMTV